MRDDARLPVWRGFLDRLQHRARQNATSRRPALVLVYRSDSDRGRLEEDVALKTLTWDDAVSRADIHALAHLKLPRGRPGSIIRLVLVNTLVEICLSDVELIGSLVKEPVEEIASPFRSLRAWAERLEGSMAGNWRQLFFEDRCYEHSASLAERGERSALRGRVWAAQARVLLPWVEERRQQLAEDLARWLPDEFQGQSRADYEIGVLDFLLFQKNAPPPLKSCVRRLKQVRNEIAHRGVLAYRQLAELPQIEEAI
jgi:hypothetical protein